MGGIGTWRRGDARARAPGYAAALGHGRAHLHRYLGAPPCARRGDAAAVTALADRLRAALPAG